MPVPIYNAAVVFVINQPRERILRDVSRLLDMEIEYPDEIVGNCCVYTGSQDCAIVMSDWVGNRHNIGTLVHELDHAAVHILKRCGINQVFETNEAYAYLKGWMTREFYQIMEEKIKFFD